MRLCLLVSDINFTSYLQDKDTQKSHGSNPDDINLTDVFYCLSTYLSGYRLTKFLSSKWLAVFKTISSWMDEKGASYSSCFYFFTWQTWVRHSHYDINCWKSLYSCIEWQPIEVDGDSGYFSPSFSHFNRPIEILEKVMRTMGTAKLMWKTVFEKRVDLFKPDIVDLLQQKRSRNEAEIETTNY